MSDIQHTTGSAAKELDCSLSLVRYFLTEGKLPYTRLANGQRIINQSAIDALKQERANNPRINKQLRQVAK